MQERDLGIDPRVECSVIGAHGTAHRHYSVEDGRVVGERFAPCADGVQFGGCGKSVGVGPERFDLGMTELEKPDR